MIPTAALPALIDRSRQWCDAARGAGWLTDADLAPLATLERATPADLFVDQDARPLVVAFFGGTGVGKSSLLNRLSGTAIARTGVERPTSREVTAYVHEVVRLTDLPADLPLSAIRIQRHASTGQRGILWLDAPDIDSTEEANRRAALAWLPHIDLLCYVVSPERYRDDAGWRVLRERGQKHGWMFIFNHWDQADPQQADDLLGMLRGAGFNRPILVRTCCADGHPAAAADEFDELQVELDRLLAEHGLQELTRLGHAARWQELCSVLRVTLSTLGSAEQWERATAQARAHWTQAAATIQEGLCWSTQALAARGAAREGKTLEPLGRAVAALRGLPPRPPVAPEPTQPAPLDTLASELWDEWAQAKLANARDGLELRWRRAGLPAEPLRRRLEAAGQSGSVAVVHCLRDHLRLVLAQPGSALQRAGRRATGFSMSFLPLIALLWVGYGVVRGYGAAVLGQAPYLGTEFAVHSVLVVLIAWAVPFTIDRLLRPSLERTLARALTAGLRHGLGQVGQQLQAAIEETARDARAWCERGTRLLAEVESLQTEARRPLSARTQRLVAQPAASVRHP